MRHPLIPVLHPHALAPFPRPPLQVPAISLNKGEEIIWESKDILLALEEKFPGAPPLLPKDEEARGKVRGGGVHEAETPTSR